MSGSLFRRRLHAAILIAAALASGPAPAQSAFKVDVPAQELAGALRDVGRQTSTNVIFEPSIVIGLKVSTLRANLTSDEALATLLKGTGLAAQRTSADTVVIKRVTAPRSSGQERVAPQAVGEDRSEEDSKREYSRATEADRGASESSAVEKNKETESASQMKPIVLEEVMVIGTHIGGEAPAGAHVVTITQDDIQKGGFTTPQDAVRSEL